MKYAVLMISISALLAGCASTKSEYQVPVPSNHAKEFQLKLQASRHWDAVAEDAAKQSMDELTQRELRSLPISVIQSGAPSPFSRALHQFLVTRLVNKGANVLREGQGKLALEYDIQVVRFSADRSNRSHPEYVPGTATALTAGVLVLHNAATLWSPATRKAALLAAAATGDVITAIQQDGVEDDSKRGIPKVEVIVNSSIVKDGVYQMRRSDIYYVNDTDQLLYEGEPHQRIRLVGDCGKDGKECQK